MSGSRRKTEQADDIKVPKTNRLGLTAPKRIDVANAAVADELSAQKLLYLPNKMTIIKPRNTLICYLARSTGSKRS